MLGANYLVCVCTIYVASLLHFTTRFTLIKVYPSCKSSTAFHGLTQSQKTGGNVVILLHCKNSQTQPGNWLRLSKTNAVWPSQFSLEAIKQQDSCVSLLYSSLIPFTCKVQLCPSALRTDIMLPWWCYILPHCINKASHLTVFCTWEIAVPISRHPSTAKAQNRLKCVLCSKSHPGLRFFRGSLLVH